jgi:hypothetical protein
MQDAVWGWLIFYCDGRVVIVELAVSASEH